MNKTVWQKFKNVSFYSFYSFSCSSFLSSFLSAILPLSFLPPSPFFFCTPSSVHLFPYLHIRTFSPSPGCFLCRTFLNIFSMLPSFIPISFKYLFLSIGCPFCTFLYLFFSLSFPFCLSRSLCLFDPCLPLFSLPFFLFRSTSCFSLSYSLMLLRFVIISTSKRSLN